jgi:hypothetical protein
MRNKKTLIALLILAAVAAYFYFNKSRSTISGELSGFAVKDTASVSRIFISTQENDKVELERAKNGIWKVNGKYTARKDAIQLLLETFYRIDVMSPVPQTAFETVVKQLASSGTKVEIYLDGKKKPEKVYYVGQATENHKGTYMLLEQGGKKSTQPFITHVPGFYGYLSTRFFTDEDLWRDREIFAHTSENIKSLKLTYGEEKSESFSMEKEGSGFKVMDAEGNPISGIDPSLINEYLNRYRSVHYEYIDNKTDSITRDSVLNSTPIYHFELTDDEGEKITLTAFRKPLAQETYDQATGELLTHNLDRCVALINGRNFVAVQYIILDPLLVTASDLKASGTVDK